MTPERIGKNRLSVITFNYDRSLEYFLCAAIKAREKGDDATALGLVRQLRIVHVHGTLGELSPADSDGRRPYRPDLSKDAVLLASRCIQVLPETKDDSEEFRLARDLIAEAERVVFLGFGFHDDNLGRLRVDRSHRQPSQRAWALARDVPDRRAIKLRERIGFDEFVRDGIEIRAFLEHFDLLS